MAFAFAESKCTPFGCATTQITLDEQQQQEEEEDEKKPRREAEMMPTKAKIEYMRICVCVWCSSLQPLRLIKSDVHIQQTTNT